MNLRIDDELRSWLPELDDEESQGLEERILAEGIREPLVVWRQQDTILDGHHRYEIAQAHGLEFDVVYLDFDDKEQAKDWIDENALARRNLTSDLFKYLIGRQYQRTKKARGGTGANQYTEQIGQIDTSATANQIAEQHGVSPRTVKRAAKFAKEIDSDADLKQALFERKPLTQVKRAKKDEERKVKEQENTALVSSVENLEDVSGAFGTIVIDPPWSWADEADVSQLGRGNPTYATMTIEQLEELPVGDKAAENAHIYLWITNRSVYKGKRLLDAWGFRYITMLTWPKPHFGMGNYFRGQTEHVMFGVRGSMPLKRKDASTLLPAWNRGPDGHSSKPVEFYEFVESCSYGPYLEMFSRTNRDGWRSWGAEVG